METKGEEKDLLTSILKALEHGISKGKQRTASKGVLSKIFLGELEDQEKKGGRRVQSFAPTSEGRGKKKSANWSNL